MVPHMPLPGQLTKDRFGYSMPVDAPLYTPFPLYYEDIRILLFPYLTDAAAAAALLPSQFELVPADPDGKFAIAQVVFARYPFSNIGAYNEVAQTIVVTYKGKPAPTQSGCTSPTIRRCAPGARSAAFRRSSGTSRSTEGSTFLSTLESPTGLPDLHRRARCRCSRSQGPDDHPTTFYSLRVIPNPVDAAKPSVCQLIETVWDLYGGTFWSARGLLHFTGDSALNPYHSLPIVQPMPPMNRQPADRSRAGDPGRGAVPRAT